MLIAELNSKLEAARKAYYSGNPVMSDAEYDSLEDQLKGLVRSNPEQGHLATVLTTVGSDMPLFADVPHPAEQLFMAEKQQGESRANGRVAHRVPMLSIENMYTVDDVCAWAESLGWPTLSVGSKLDGVSDSLVYEDGELRQALTRGDGTSGESVLSQIRRAGGVPSFIRNSPFTVRVEIRGEVVIAQSTLKLLNEELVAAGGKPYASTRNLAAGTLKLGDLEEVKRRGLLFRPWDVLLPHGFQPDSAVGRLKEITAFGFAPSDDRIVTNREELIAAIEEMLPTLQEPGSEIGMDGIVIKVDSHELREKLGRGSKFTNYQVCFKPQNQKAETVIREVEWQVGRQGKITPVAIVEPVTLGGVQIARATLNNFTWLSTLGVRIGSKVGLVRSGDVIPKITEVLEQPAESIEIAAPDRCPDCGSLVTASSEEDSTVTTHYCDSDICPGRIRDLLTYIADRTVLEIDGLGPELAGKLVETGMVKSLSTALSDLFQFQTDTRNMIVLYGQKSAEALLQEKGFPVVLTLRMIESIDRARTAPWPVWIAAMAIPMIGRRLGKVLAAKLNLQLEDLPALPAKFEAIQLGGIEGLGVSKLGELQRYAANPAWIQLCSALYAEGVRPTAIVTATSGDPKPLEGVSFVLTGEFDAIGTREHISALLEARGAVAKSGVSKNVTHLIVGSAPGKSKLTKAEQLGIQQVGAGWLTEALAD